MANRHNNSIKNKRIDIAKANSANRCKGKTPTGEDCRAAPTPSGLCFFHANPNKASELGRIGGRSHGRSLSEIGSALPNLETAASINKALAQLILDVYAGRIDHKVAVALAGMLNTLRTAKEGSELESHITELRKQLADARASGEKHIAGEAPMLPQTILGREPLKQ